VATFDGLLIRTNGVGWIHLVVIRFTYPLDNRGTST
jgi:hypothetical protein